MKCPNCQLPFDEEKAPKFLCSTCGWLEKVGKEWKNCDAPESPPPGESPPPQETPPPPEPSPPPEPDPAAQEPDPAAQEPDPAALEPDPKVKSYLGGLLTVTRTEIDE